MKSFAYAPVLSQFEEGGLSRTYGLSLDFTRLKVTLKSHIRQPLFLQSLDPI